MLHVVSLFYYSCTDSTFLRKLHLFREVNQPGYRKANFLSARLLSFIQTV